MAAEEKRTCGNCEWTQKGVYKLNVVDAKGTEVVECHVNPPQFFVGLTGMPSRGWPAVFSKDKACSQWKKQTTAQEEVILDGKEAGAEEGSG